ncbi:hypothetical protein [Streptomyces griseiscabiei]|uniref:Uncharacterized protein n=1 Tax=Streptomyces griseiscabiei TaxID=2993540 RepID=A0ABU4KYW1_9ACTN|nr:hypothetical protein [Streptomyces griseiscabiei]MDX2908508.1 hypothetical protein [Streptomyces griseiscabiei]
MSEAVSESADPVSHPVDPADALGPAGVRPPPPGTPLAADVPGTAAQAPDVPGTAPQAPRGLDAPEAPEAPHAPAGFAGLTRSTCVDAPGPPCPRGPPAALAGSAGTPGDSEAPGVRGAPDDPGAPGPRGGLRTVSDAEAKRSSRESAATEGPVSPLASSYNCRHQSSS